MPSQTGQLDIGGLLDFRGQLYGSVSVSPSSIPCFLAPTLLYNKPRTLYINFLNILICLMFLEIQPIEEETRLILYYKIRVCRNVCSYVTELFLN